MTQGSTSMSILSRTLLASLTLGTLVTACGDDGDTTPATPDAPAVIDAAVTPDAPGPTVYRQIEQLARPGINEALLLSEGFLAGYNATAPTFTGVDATTLTAVVSEAKTVLKAIYLGTCLINGVAGVTDPQMGAKPAGLPCAAMGGAIFEGGNPLTGTVVTAVAMAGAQAYADRVFAQFIPDVMRIDTSVPSAYLTLCDGASATAPLLCGGRKLNEDVIDITYFYLLAGASVPTGIPAAQAVALVSDGVQFSSNNANNSGNNTQPDAANTNQFHPNVSTTFPYSAPPL